MKIYDKENDRLLFYGKNPSSNFWDKHWDKHFSKNVKGIIENYKNNQYILRLARKYIKDDNSPILEGGCGVGGYVYCLHNHGYNAYGVDIAKDTIKKVKKVYPDLKISVQDLRKLSFKNGYFDLYISFGVIEHFYNGYNDVIKEAIRVVKNEGYLIITFPQISLLRRIKILLNFYKKSNSFTQKGFYQFAFNPKCILFDMKKYGLKKISKRSRDGLKGMKDEIFLLKPILQFIFNYKGKNFFIRVIRRALDVFLAPFSGHMCELILQKRFN